ncbi:DUF1972 domain-containing protein [Aestuariibius sp. HNIBRBA575]|uniref:DUF1972 domain-containing protein n=1 Tax=Aestuariibius sp. HNIBRBA575 TaxID=3233343 RepID=UPI0034A57D7C
MQVNILGTRGIPASHGGFETFVGRLAPYLRDQGHDVVVYCQRDAPAEGPKEDDYQGIKRVHFTPKRGGPVGTMEFDLACVRDVVKRPGVDLVLGYNTAIFNVLERLRRRPVVMNMDGIEWKRAKWGIGAKAWFYLNEVAGANLCHVAVADHPEIAKHVQARCFKTPVMIPYGADKITDAPDGPVRDLGLEPGRYFVSIARAEPENSILEMVQAFSSLQTDTKCLVLGNLSDDVPYHRAVQAAAGDNVIFPGGIYDPAAVAAIRFHALAYLHGHQVGGTNPSLVEALGAGNPVLAHDNRFNRWTAGAGQFYFSDTASAAAQMQRLLDDPAAAQAARDAARNRHAEAFLWDDVLKTYEDVLIDTANRRK